MYEKKIILKGDILYKFFQNEVTHVNNIRESITFKFHNEKQ